jgi:hypothetical protein
MMECLEIESPESKFVCNSIIFSTSVVRVAPEDVIGKTISLMAIRAAAAVQWNLG